MLRQTVPIEQEQDEHERAGGDHEAEKARFHETVYVPATEVDVCDRETGQSERAVSA